jgi:outer membrane immunogenic protein
MSGSSRGNGVTVPGFNFPLYAKSSRAVYWFGTVRARFGATLFDPDLLIYGTAGLAYGRVGYGQTFLDSDLDVGGKTLSSVRTGWTLGAGLEYALSQAWSAKAEYFFTDLGKAPNLNLAEIMPGVAAQPNVIKSFNVTPTRFHTLRVGVNYRFGSFSAAPFLLKYRSPL